MCGSTIRSSELSCEKQKTMHLITWWFQNKSGIWMEKTVSCYSQLLLPIEEFLCVSKVPGQIADFQRNLSASSAPQCSPRQRWSHGGASYGWSFPVAVTYGYIPSGIIKHGFQIHDLYGFPWVYRDLLFSLVWFNIAI